MIARGEDVVAAVAHEGSRVAWCCWVQVVAGQALSDAKRVVEVV
jgi:hypothetical protein